MRVYSKKKEKFVNSEQRAIDLNIFYFELVHSLSVGMGEVIAENNDPHWGDIKISGCFISATASGIRNSRLLSHDNTGGGFLHGITINNSPPFRMATQSRITFANLRSPGSVPSRCSVIACSTSSRSSLVMTIFVISRYLSSIESISLPASLCFFLFWRSTTVDTKSIG